MSLFFSGDSLTSRRSVPPEGAPNHRLLLRYTLRLLSWRPFHRISHLPVLSSLFNLGLRGKIVHHCLSSRLPVAHLASQVRSSRTRKLYHTQPRFVKRFAPPPVPPRGERLSLSPSCRTAVGMYTSTYVEGSQPSCPDPLLESGQSM